MQTTVQRKSRNVNPDLAIPESPKRRRTSRNPPTSNNKSSGPTTRSTEPRLQREGSSASQWLSHKLVLSQESQCVLRAKTGAAHGVSDSMTQWSTERLQSWREDTICVFFHVCKVWYVCTVSSGCIFVYKLFVQVIEAER